MCFWNRFVSVTVTSGSFLHHDLSRANRKHPSRWHHVRRWLDQSAEWIGEFQCLRASPHYLEGGGFTQQEKSLNNSDSIWFFVCLSNLVRCVYVKVCVSVCSQEMCLSFPCLLFIPLWVCKTQQSQTLMNLETLKSHLKLARGPRCGCYPWDQECTRVSCRRVCVGQWAYTWGI